MTTVASRKIRSSPYRDTTKTWELIVDILTQGKNAEAKGELLSVSGIAACVIADRGPEDAAIVVTCDGPRTRIYCLYDEDAIDGADAKEDALGYDPLSGTWSMSLPCPKHDLDWVQGALRAKTTRITARDLSENAVASNESSAKTGQELTLDVKAFLKP